MCVTYNFIVFIDLDTQEESRDSNLRVSVVYNLLTLYFLFTYTQCNVLSLLIK